MHLGWLLGLDLAIYLGFAAMFAIGEGKSRWLHALTISIAVVLTTVAALNAAYLSRAGQQLSWGALTLAVERMDDLRAIVRERAGHISPGAFVAVVLWLVAVPIAAARWLKHLGKARSEKRFHRQRAHAAAVVVLVGVLLRTVLPAPLALPMQELGANAAIRTYWGWITYAEPERPASEMFAGYHPHSLVAKDAIAQFSERSDKPNIVLLVLESTRFDFTSLAGVQSPADTPALVALAERGMNMTTTRAVLPHTTKSLFSVLCGRFPLMQQAIVEVSQHIDVECLPHVLAKAGYRTAFFQSALGTFENRPRLVDKMGYAHFAAWEDIGGQPLGYLASDDESLHGAFSAWVDRGDGPFFATLLTSAAHDPYRLSKAIAQRLQHAPKPAQTAKQRYARLVEAQDQLLAHVLSALVERGKRDDTIVVVLGDHGEGFGDKGVRQHDNNFYEEGLRVPWVIAGPNVPRKTIRHNVSLIDVAPTLLDLLEVPIVPSASPGVSVLAPSDDPQPQWFACWYDFHCRGFVLGDDKVVFMPKRRQLFYFSLKEDPLETTPLPLTPALEQWLPALNRIMGAHQTRQLSLGGIREYGKWRCPPNERCTHPESPDGFFATNSDTSHE